MNKGGNRAPGAQRQAHTRLINSTNYYYHYLRTTPQPTSSINHLHNSSNITNISSIDHSTEQQHEREKKLVTGDSVAGNRLQFPRPGDTTHTHATIMTSTIAFAMPPNLGIISAQVGY